MPFSTRPILGDNYFEQPLGTTLTMSGDTDFVGKLMSKGTEINLDVTSANVGDVLTLQSDGSIILETPQAGGASGETYITETFTTNTLAGAIAAQTSIQSGTTLTQFAKMLTISTFYPTFTDPTYSITTNQASSVESGSILNILVTYTFNRGTINGKMVGGIWQPLTMQDYRAGAATQYIINGTNLSTTNNTTLSSYNIVDSINSFSGSVAHLIGPQPVDSLSANYGSQYPAATINRSTTITGKRNTFWGVSSLANSSATIRALGNNYLGHVNSNTFTINIPVGATSVCFSYPDSLRFVNSVKYVEGLNAEVKDIFALTYVTVAGANSYSPITYKVYRYVPAEAFTSTATYTVTI